MDEELLELIKKVIEDKGSVPKLATFKQIRDATSNIPNKGLLNETFKSLIIDGKIKIREGINQKMIEVL